MRSNWIEKADNSTCANIGGIEKVTNEGIIAHKLGLHKRKGIPLEDLRQLDKKMSEEDLYTISYGLTNFRICEIPFEVLDSRDNSMMELHASNRKRFREYVILQEQKITPKQRSTIRRVFKLPGAKNVIDEILIGDE